MREGEPPLLIYSTADGQSVDQAIPLKRPEGEYRYQCRLPPGNLGLQQDLEYYLTAGDYRTRRYRVDVQIAPAIVVDKVSYHYPAYTGIADQTVERQGDLAGDRRHGSHHPRHGQHRHQAGLGRDRPRLHRPPHG